jgi:hypothetical protein
MGTLGRWFIFLTVFLCVYGAAHLYVLIKVRRALYLESTGYLFLLLVLTFLMLAPIQARILSTQGFPLFSLVMHWLGYLWMGFLFLLICLSAPIDLYHLLINGLRWLFETDWTDWLLSRRQSLAMASLGALGLMIYGAVAAYHIRIEHVTLVTSKIPASTGRIRIAQISDLHLGPMFYPGRLDPILAALQKAQPDILVSTGDLIDGPRDDEDEAAMMLRSLPAPLGKFAVTGNHEYYVGLQHATNFIQKAGFQLLNGLSVPVKEHLAVVGVPDAADRSEGQISEAALMAGLPPDKFILLLKHRPVVDEQVHGQFDLQLSGHTHQGQIFPFGLLIKLFYPVRAGLSPLTPSGHLYLSRGTGTWGPPVRIFAPPEITVIDLVPDK